MRIVLVGQRQGKCVVRWANCLALGLCLSLTMGLGVGGVYYLLSGSWSHGTVLYGIAAGVGMAAFGLIRGLAAPVNQLTALD
jgi:hypothetical protein